MKKAIIGIMILFVTQIFANQIGFEKCTESKIDKSTKIFICADIQYLVEYDSYNIYQKITLIQNGKTILIKDKTKK